MHNIYHLTKTCFTDDMKITKIVSLFRSGYNNTFNNNRDASFFPHFSEILEKLSGNRFSGFIEKISNLQYGFHNKLSTSLALIELVEVLTTRIHNK